MNGFLLVSSVALVKVNLVVPHYSVSSSHGFGQNYCEHNVHGVVSTGIIFIFFPGISFPEDFLWRVIMNVASENQNMKWLV